MFKGEEKKPAGCRRYKSIRADGGHVAENVCWAHISCHYKCKGEAHDELRRGVAALKIVLSLRMAS